MKHTIEIEGLPENIEIEGAEICTSISSVYDGMSIGIILKTKLKKKQPRRIVLEETKELKKLEIILKNRYWRIVEDSGGNND